MTEIDEKLQKVLAQARELSIPVSSKVQNEVVINNRAKTRFGCCRKTKSGYVIEISKFLISGPEKAIYQTLAHEVLHTCPGCQNHSLDWKAHAETMNRFFDYNIKRTSTPLEMGMEEGGPVRSPRPVKYAFVCKKCGRRIERSKKSKLVTHTHLFKCLCGGKIEKLT